MKIAIHILASANLAAASAAGFAQPPQNSARFTEQASSAEDRQVLHRFAQCLTEREQRGARALLATDFTSPAYPPAMRRYARNNWTCAPSGVLRAGGVLFVGALAEALLARSIARGTLAARIAVDPARPALPARDQMEVMSLCMVGAAPAEVEALLAAAPGGADEATALRPLSPRIGECLAAGVSARLNRPALRAMLALAAYRLVEHNSAAPAAARN